MASERERLAAWCRTKQRLNGYRISCIRPLVQCLSKDREPLSSVTCSQPPRNRNRGEIMRVTAPFSVSQIHALQRYQTLNHVHPFTCINSRRLDHGWLPMFASRLGFICPYCEHRQNWAHSFMADMAQHPKPPASIIGRALAEQRGEGKAQEGKPADAVFPKEEITGTELRVMASDLRIIREHFDRVAPVVLKVWERIKQGSL